MRARLLHEKEKWHIVQQTQEKNNFFGKSELINSREENSFLWVTEKEKIYIYTLPQLYWPENHI